MKTLFWRAQKRRRNWILYSWEAYQDIKNNWSFQRLVSGRSAVYLCSIIYVRVTDETTDWRRRRKKKENLELKFINSIWIFSKESISEEKILFDIFCCCFRSSRASIFLLICTGKNELFLICVYTVGWKEEKIACLTCMFDNY
jgi:hypothetical protein